MNVCCKICDIFRVGGCLIFTSGSFDSLGEKNERTSMSFDLWDSKMYKQEMSEAKSYKRCQLVVSHRGQ